MAEHLHLIVLLPLLGALLVGAFGRRLGRGFSAGVACLAVFGSFLLSHAAWSQVASDGNALVEPLFRWFSVGSFEVPAELYLDRISAVMALVVTGVGFLIHVYSAGYMGHDPDHARYFACLNLFTFFMLTLVLGKSLPLVFVGWEGVGLCSYLLIGFWFDDPEKARAGKKAFLVNRAGDIGFVAGMLLLGLEVERATGVFSLDFVQMQGAIAFLGDPANTVAFLGVSSVAWALLLLFFGATGKSAQIPLYVWLPDAMAGPTPVSALIHAATMVTSGVYLVARLHPFFLLVPNVLVAIAWVGAATALFAATIAVAQTDIKKVLAWSTISQLGYMFLALGVGAFAGGMFHLVTHAFFKGLLFLAAGSVIHALHGEQDILRMGGLSGRIRATFLLFAAGWFAICALPPGSGFHSKDAILHAALNSATGGVAIFAIGLFTGALTAYYMSRLFFLVFLAPPAKGIDHAKAHESPAVMLAPMGALALFSLAGGYLPVPAFLAPAFKAGIPEVRHVSHALVGALSTLGALLGVLLAWRIHLFRPREAARLAHAFALPREFASRGYRIDDLYDALFVRPALACGRLLERLADGALLDGLFVHGSARLAKLAGSAARAVQTGLLSDSLLAVFAGTILVLWLLTR